MTAELEQLPMRDLGGWTRDEACAYVTHAYAASVVAIIETGRRLAEVKAGLPHGQWLACFEGDGKMPFTDRAARYLMEVARHPALSNRKHASDLPTGWFTLAQLARLAPAEIEARIEAGELTPETERRTVQDWIRHRDITPVRDTPPLPEGTFRTIEADPPWSYADAAPGAQWAPDNTYAVMPTADICALPVQQLAAEDGCHLYLWTTTTHLRESFDVVDAWGFRYKTLLTWVKPRMGLGSHWRGQTEFVLFATMGTLPPESRDKPNYFTADAPRRHSAKPADFYSLVETVSPGPYVRLFARSQRDGWTSWGAEA